MASLERFLECLGLVIWNVIKTFFGAIGAILSLIVALVFAIIELFGLLLGLVIALARWIANEIGFMPWLLRRIPVPLWRFGALADWWLEWTLYPIVDHLKISWGEWVEHCLS